MLAGPVVSCLCPYWPLAGCQPVVGVGTQTISPKQLGPATICISKMSECMQDDATFCTSKTERREWELYACRYDRNPSLAALFYQSYQQAASKTVEVGVPSRSS